MPQETPPDLVTIRNGLLSATRRHILDLALFIERTSRELDKNISDSQKSKLTKMLDIAKEARDTENSRCNKILNVYVL